MRTFMLAVTGLVFAVAACSSYGTSVVEVGKTKAQVASVSLTVPSSLAAGRTARAIATPKDANGTALTDRPVTWFTSSALIASVSDSGMISAVAPGTAVVSAVSEGIAGQATMAVVPPPPTPIATVLVAVNPSAVLVGQAALATATLEDSSGNLLSGRVVTWQSADISVATVDATGHVKGVGPGNAMIKATSEGKTSASSLSVSAPAPIPVASVSVSPTTASLQVGASVQLSAVTRDANSNVLAGRVISWSSGNAGIATVSSSGLVAAVAGGSVSITAASEGQTGSAAITVSAPAPVAVASVSVSPATATVQVGGTVQFSAVTRDANNNVLTGRVITWSSSNSSLATVSASGLVTTLAAGTAQIKATSELQIGSATLTITSPPPPPPGGGPVWRGNEPAGMTLINERPFSALNETGWGSLTNPGATIETDAAAPHSPPNVVRFNYPAGFPGGAAPEHAAVSVPNYRVLYISYWCKYSANWWGHLTGINKHGYAWAAGNPVFVMESEGVGSAPLYLRFAIQGTGTSSDGWYTQNLVPGAVLTRGQWDYVEIVATGNSAGTADGSMDFWLNGVHVGSYTGLQWTSGATQWNEYQLNPIWGGVGDTVPADQAMDFDHFYVSAKN